MTAVLVGTIRSKVLSYTDNFDWICREAESVTFDMDGKSVLESITVKLVVDEPLLWQ